MENIQLSVSDFISLTNQTLEYAYPTVEILGEVQGFKVNQNKYVFFDLKDEHASVGCFMMLWQLRTPIEDGMKIVVSASPRLTTWGKFSLTVKTIKLEGEGSLKRGFELLIKKLQKEGLFEASRKRILPALPVHIGVVGSTESAGYADFMTILSERWGGLKITSRHVQVQGKEAPEQIISAITAFNESANPPEIIVLLRGGGSMDDLSTFNDEPLVRAIAASRVPIITGIGHETDTTIADMVADVRASTPSNVAERIVPDKREIVSHIRSELKASMTTIASVTQKTIDMIVTHKQHASHNIEKKMQEITHSFHLLKHTLTQLNPSIVLARGYAIVRDEKGGLIKNNPKKGDSLSIETKDVIIRAGVEHVRKKE